MMPMQLSSDDTAQANIMEAGVRIGDVYALLVGEHAQLGFVGMACWHECIARNLHLPHLLATRSGSPCWCTSTCMG